MAHPRAVISQAPNGDLRLLRLPWLLTVPLRPDVLKPHARKPSDGWPSHEAENPGGITELRVEAAGGVTEKVRLRAPALQG